MFAVRNWEQLHTHGWMRPRFHNDVVGPGVQIAWDVCTELE